MIKRVIKMESGGGGADAKMKKSAKEKLKTVKIKRSKACLMKKAYELSTLCATPVCVIVFMNNHSQPETWPSDSGAANLVIQNYKNIVSNPNTSKNTINLTVGDIILGRKRRVVEDVPKKVWENEECPADLDQFPFHKLLLLDEKINATLKKIDDVMVTNLQASLNPPVPFNYFKDQLVDDCAYDSNYAVDSFIKKLMSDDDDLKQFGGQQVTTSTMIGETSCSNRYWYTDDTASSNQIMQQLSFDPMLPDHHSYGVMASFNSVSNGQFGGEPSGYVNSMEGFGQDPFHYLNPAPPVALPPITFHDHYSAGYDEQMLPNSSNAVYFPPNNDWF